MRLSRIYVLSIALVAAFNFIEFTGQFQLIWIIAPIGMLSIMVVSVPFMAGIFRAMRLGRLPEIEDQRLAKRLLAVLLLLFAAFFLQVFLKR